jgi:hypothetical protein
VELTCHRYVDIFELWRVGPPVSLSSLSFEEEGKKQYPQGRNPYLNVSTTELCPSVHGPVPCFGSLIIGVPNQRASKKCSST